MLYSHSHWGGGGGLPFSHSFPNIFTPLLHITTCTQIDFTVATIFIDQRVLRNLKSNMVGQAKSRIIFKYNHSQGTYTTLDSVGLQNTLGQQVCHGIDI